MLSARKSFKEVVLWMIFSVSRSLDTFLCHFYISAQLRIIHQHTHKHTHKTKTETHLKALNPLIIAGFKWSKMTPVTSNNRVFGQSLLQWYCNLKGTGSGHKIAGGSSRCRIWETCVSLISLTLLIWLMFKLTFFSFFFFKFPCLPITYLKHSESTILPMAVLLLISVYIALFFFCLNSQPSASWWYQPYENIGITSTGAKVPLIRGVFLTLVPGQLAHEATGLTLCYSMAFFW